MMTTLKKPDARHDDAPYKGKYNWYVAGLVVAALVFVVSASIAHKGQATGWECQWFRIANNWTGKLFRPMEVITLLGSMWAAAVVVVLAFAVRYYRLAWRLSLSVLTGYGLMRLAKYFVDRARPSGLFDHLHQRATENLNGFPSGHALVITIVTLTLLPYVPNKWRLAIPLLIVLVDLSRIYLGVHLPLDVLGGVALGTVIVAAVRILPQSLRVLLRVD